MIDTIIYPSEYFTPHKVDEEYAREYQAALKTEYFQPIIFDYDKWFEQDKLVLFGDTVAGKQAIYRGWMMTPEKYKRFYFMLFAHNVKLITDPDAYRRLHVFTNAYQELGTDTAYMMEFPVHRKIDVNVLKEKFDRFIVKDAVKSVKGSEFPAFFDGSITQDEFDHWMELFYLYRGELLTGNICIKQYLPLKHYHGATNEYRVFYFSNQVLSITANSNQPGDANVLPLEMAKKYSHLDSPYYTVDFAELEDGSWKVIETGDGGVSGLPDGEDTKMYYQKLKRFCMMK